MLFSKLVAPLIRLTNGAANAVLHRLGIEPTDELSSARSPQELVPLVRTSAKQGALDPPTAALVDRSLQFGGRSAEEFMTPRSKIESLEADDTVGDLLAMVRDTTSRFPVTRGDLDDDRRRPISNRSVAARRPGAHPAGPARPAGSGGALDARR